MWETYLFAVVEFLSTPSARRATQSGRPDRDRCVISIHALREEGDVVDGDRPRDVSISIHALREEGDAQRGWNRATPRYFYPRPPRGGRLKQPVFSHNRRIISIHALREEGDVSPYRGDQQHAISIHALREEGDVMEMQPAFWQLLFLSTPSARRATEVCGADRRICEISIHALREEGDYLILVL